MTTTTEIELFPLAATDLADWLPRACQRIVDQRVRAGWRPVDAESLASHMPRRALADGGLGPDQLVWWVARHGVEAGYAWLVLAEGAEAAHVVCLDVEAGAAQEAFAAVAESARDRGARRLMVSRFAGDQVTDEFLSGQDLTLMATKMELDLSGEPGAGDRVRLVHMTPQRFDDFVHHEIEHYAQEMYDAGSVGSLAAARADSRRQHEQLLPRGLETPGQWLWSAFDGETEVGVLWVNVDGDRAFIYDIEVEESCRRRGYGGATLRAGAVEAASEGAKMLGLNVFGPNSGARALYAKSRFIVTEEIVYTDL